MAVETKIGLVVGLGFIVCFGVILQHRGSGDRLSTDVALELLNRHREPVAASQPPRFEKFTRSNPGVGRTISALPNRNVPVQQPRTQKVNGRSPAARRNAGASRRGAQSAKTRPTRPSATRNKPRMTAKPQPRRQARTQTPKTTPPPSPAYEALFGEDTSATSPVREPQPQPEVKKPQTQQRSKPPAQRAPVRRPKPVPKENRTYVVKSGDSLWGIAEREYGRRSRELVDALYAANRGQMSSPGALKVGMRLILPDADEGNAEPRTKRTSVTHRASPVGPVRFYQVQQGDRYTTIAERFLGDKSRWKELFELNKDIFPDAGKIRPGVRIRLPATVLADAR